MPVISGLVTFAGKTTLVAHDLDTCFNAFVKVVGGTDSAGVIWPGNLDYRNFGDAAITNDQKAQPKSQFQVAWAIPSTTAVTAGAQAAMRGVKLPFACYLTAVTAGYYDTAGTAGQYPTSGNLLVQAWSNGTAVTVASINMSYVRGWQPNPGTTAVYNLQVPVTLNAGDILTLDQSAFVFAGGATSLNNLNVCLYFSAYHVS